LNACRDGASTASLGNLFQCITTLCVKNFLLISNLNLPRLSLKPFPLVLSLRYAPAPQQDCNQLLQRVQTPVLSHSAPTCKSLWISDQIMRHISPEPDVIWISYLGVSTFISELPESKSSPTDRTALHISSRRKAKPTPSFSVQSWQALLAYRGNYTWNTWTATAIIWVDNSRTALAFRLSHASFLLRSRPLGTRKNTLFNLHLAI